MVRQLLRLSGVLALVVVAGACAPPELTSAQAQAMLDEQLSAGVAEVLGVRQTGDGEALARVRIAALADLGGAEVDVGFALFDTGWRPEGEVEVLGTMVPIEEISDAIGRDLQLHTMAMMRNIATANGVMRVDTGNYARNLAELTPEYMQAVPANDGWGNAFIYSTGADTYTITSQGSDGAAGPAPPAPWVNAPYTPDIILSDGRFVQAPTGR